jgi:putative ABC transport system permease protein
MENEMDAELRFHIEAFAEDLIRSGMPRQEAMRQARLEFGSVERAKEECRNARGINLVETLIQDVGYAMRATHRSWGFTAVAVPTLALGIGATTAIFSVVKAVILNPLPFRQPAKLVHLWEGFGQERYRQGDEAYFSTVRPGNFYDWRTESQSFESMSAYRRRPMLLTSNKRAELVSAQDVYDRFFETLGTPAYLGRTLQATDYEPSAAPVVVVSNAMWIKRFGKDPRVVGRRISLDRESYEIVGVMPAGFYPTSGGYPELWTPHWANQKEKDDRTTWGLITVARLRPGVTWEQAQTELDVVSARMTKDHPTSEKMHAVVVPVSAQLIGSSWKLLLLLSAGVTLLLLIACVNVANLLLARVVNREKEFAIRTALGTGRGRLVLQLFAESLIVAVAAGTLGLGVASAGTHALLALLPQSATLPRLDSAKVDLPVLTFVCGITLLTSLLLSLIPILKTSRNRPYDLLKLEGRSLSTGKSKRRLGQIFVVSEFVFSLVLLILGVLLVESFIELRRVDPGFRANDLLVFHVPVPEVNYGRFVDGDRNTAREKLYEQLEQILNAVPGIESAAFTAGLPLEEEFNPWGVRIKGHELPPSGSEGDTGIQMVNPQFFHTLGIKLARGRFFEERDKADAPMAAVINETFARSFFPHEDPLGKLATVWYGSAIIVGVVADFKLNALDRKPYPEIFWSIRQAPSRNVWIMARTNSDPSLLQGAVRQKIQDFDSELPVLEMHSMNEVISDSLWLKRLSADLIGVVAGLAIILAGTGIYSVMSYSVSQRKKEVGIRIAFGADRRDVFVLVMGETCRLALLGSVLGCVVAFIAGHVAINTSYLAPSLASSQSRVALNPAAFVASSLFLSAIAICASFAPAHRALRVDPVVALQGE